VSEFKKTMDAPDWATGLNDVLVAHNEQPIDPDLLLGWFANALMHGHDSCEHNDARIETLREAAKRGCEGCRTRGWTEALGTDSPIGWHHLTVGGQGGPHTMKCKVPFIHDILAELEQEGAGAEVGLV